MILLSQLSAFGPPILILAAAVVLFVSVLNPRGAKVGLQVLVAVFSVFCIYLISWDAIIVVGTERSLGFVSPLTLVMILLAIAYFTGAFATSLGLLSMHVLRRAGLLLHFGIAPVTILLYCLDVGLQPAVVRGNEVLAFALMWYRMYDALLMKERERGAVSPPCSEAS